MFQATHSIQDMTEGTADDISIICSSPACDLILPRPYCIAPPPFCPACCKGFTEEVVWLLDKCEPPVDVNLLDGGGRSALHFAAGWGRVDIVKELIVRGAALETRDMWRKAPVDWALQAHQAEVVQLMRIEAVKRGVWGGRGKVAPLTTMTEATVGKTHEEVQADVEAFTRKIYGEQARRDEMAA